MEAAMCPRLRWNLRGVGRRGGAAATSSATCAGIGRRVAYGAAHPRRMRDQAVA
jgi:hypothetical protein